MKFVLALSIFVFLSSCCIQMPEYQKRENLIAPPPLDVTLQNGFRTPFFTSGDFPDKEWWRLFNSCELNELIAYALGNNPHLFEVASRIDQAKNEAVISRAKFFPLLAFDAKDTYVYLSKNGLYRALNPDIPLSANLIDLTLSLTYEFDFWGKNTNLLMASIGEELKAIAETEDAALILTTAVTAVYFALKTNLAKKAYYEELVLEREKVMALQNKMTMTLRSKLPYLSVEEAVYEAKQWVYTIENEIESNLHELNYLLGRGADAPLCIDSYIPDLPDTLTLPCTLSLDLLARRPDLMAQIWHAEALSHRVGAAIADFYPNVNIMAFIGIESTTFRRVFKESSLTAGTTPALHLPIFTAGAIRANVNIQKALFDEAIFNYNDLLLRSVQEVADAVSFGKAVFSKREEQKKLLDSLEKRYDLTLLRKKSGLDSLFEAYAIEDSLILERIDDLTLLFNQYLAAVRLIKALGGGYSASYVPLMGDLCK